MVEHVDCLGGDAAMAAPAGRCQALAEASQKEAGALRYEITGSPRRASITPSSFRCRPTRKPSIHHETATHTLQFPVATAQGGPAWRANLSDQRLCRAL